MANDNRNQPRQNTPAPITQPEGRDSSKPDPNAPSPNMPVAMGWLEACERLLLDSGWQRLGTNDRGIGVWRDPLGSDAKPEQSLVIQLPGAGGTVETVKQYLGAPIPWDYTTDEAVRIQQDRNRNGDGSLERLIQVKEAELVALKRQLAEQAKQPAKKVS